MCTIESKRSSLSLIAILGLLLNATHGYLSPSLSLIAFLGPYAMLLIVSPSLRANKAFWCMHRFHAAIIVQRRGIVIKGIHW